MVGLPRARSAARTLFVLAALVLAPVAVAADADTLVKEGVALRRSGDDVGALNKFEQAHALEQSARTLAQIGLAEQALGRWGAADRHLRAALAGPGDAWVGKNRKSIEQALKTVEQHVGQLEIVGSPAGGEVRVDGELVGKLPLERAVAASAGSVAVEVRAPGYLPVLRSAQIAVGGVTRESFNLQPLSPSTSGSASAGTGANGGGAATTLSANPSVGGPQRGGSVPDASDPRLGYGGADQSTTPPPDSGATARGGIAPGHVAAAAAGGLAVGALALGIFQHVKWQDRVATFYDDDRCDPNTPDHGSPACKTLYDEGQSARTMTFVSYGLAGAFGAAAVVLYLVTPSPAAPAQVSLSCTPDPTALGFSCGGRF